MAHIKEFYPSDQDATRQDYAVVLLNHGGSRLNQDTGRDAQDLANRLERVVVAADRPGTDTYLPQPWLASRLSSPSGYIHEMTKLGIALDAVCDQLGTAPVIAGRSAGATAGAVLARTETLGKQLGLFAAEPLITNGLLTTEAGHEKVTRYQQAQLEWQAEHNESAVLPQPPGLPWFATKLRGLALPVYSFLDTYHNQRAWTSGVALDSFEALAHHQPALPVWIEFAGFSLTGEADILRQLTQAGGHRQPSDAPFVLARSVRTSHASYDNRAYFAERLHNALIAILPELEGETDTNSRL